MIEQKPRWKKVEGLQHLDLPRNLIIWEDEAPPPSIFCLSFYMIEWLNDCSELAVNAQMQAANVGKKLKAKHLQAFAQCRSILAANSGKPEAPKRWSHESTGLGFMGLTIF